MNDLDFMYTKLFSDNDVMRWLLCARAMSKFETTSFLEKYFPLNFTPYGLGTLCLKSTNEKLGYAGIIKCPYLNENDFEIGFAIKKDEWGKGYASEIGLAETDYALNTMKLPRILSLTHPENKVSAHVIRKLGYKFIKTIQIADRGPRDVYEKTLNLL